MPVVSIRFLEGRKDEQKKMLVENVTKAVCESIGTKPENVTVFIEEFKKVNFGKYGKSGNDL
jgi:4-oxalocrotonate tautomerase